MKKELTSLLFAALMILGLATPASAQLFGEPTPGNTNNTLVQAEDCDTDQSDDLTCERVLFQNTSEPSVIGLVRMELGREYIGYEGYLFGMLLDTIESEPGFDDVTRNVDWEFLDEYDDFAAYQVVVDDPSIPNMTMLIILDGTDIYAFIFMEVDNETAHDYTRDTLEAGEFIAAPEPFKQIDFEAGPDVSFV